MSKLKDIYNKLDKIVSIGALNLICIMITGFILIVCWPYIIMDKLMDSVFYKEDK